MKLQTVLFSMLAFVSIGCTQNHFVVSAYTKFDRYKDSIAILSYDDKGEMVADLSFYWNEHSVGFWDNKEDFREDIASLAYVKAIRLPSGKYALCIHFKDGDEYTAGALLLDQLGEFKKMIAEHDVISQP
jgi:hypothetical protein